MGRVLLSILAATLIVGTTPTDPIDKLVADLSSNGLWENGSSPSLDLPKTAITEEVVAKTFATTGFPIPAGKAVTYKIVEIKQVHIKGSLPDLYTAVLLKTDRVGYQVMLLKYLEGTPGFWWTKIIGVNDAR
jgi:hypothetical protein